MDINNKVLVQLLVFEHTTGGGTIQIETGRISMTLINVTCVLDRIHYFAALRFELVREAIDKAVAEQFGRKPEPPYIERQRDDPENFWLIQHNRTNGIDGQCYKALCEIAGKELPVVDGSASQVKSEWKQVFPPKSNLPGYATGCYVEIAEQIEKETAFTIWRLTVTR